MSLLEGFEPDTLACASFCYEANFSHWASPRGHELEVGRILYPSWRNACLDQIGAIFHAGNGFYLHVVEGPAECVAWYLNHFQTDERRRRFKLLASRPIEQRDFTAGHIRFVGTQEQLSDIQRDADERSFNPYIYDKDMIEAFVTLGLK